MESGEQFSALRKAILSVCPVEEVALNQLINIFKVKVLKPDDFFTRGGEYSSHFGFIKKGIIKSYYQNLKGQNFIKGIYVDQMFVLPLPSFIYRKPTYLNFQTVIHSEIVQASYVNLEELMHKFKTIQRFVHKLIENEWILGRELHESGLHVYNASSRYQLFVSRYGSFYDNIPLEDIASFLGITVKQLVKFKKDFQTTNIP